MTNRLDKINEARRNGTVIKQSSVKDEFTEDNVTVDVKNRKSAHYNEEVALESKIKELKGLKIKIGRNEFDILGFNDQVYGNKTIRYYEIIIPNNKISEIIEISSSNVRPGFSLDNIVTLDLDEEIKEDGKNTQPVLSCTSIEGNKIEVFDGQRRTASAIKNGADLLAWVTKQHTDMTPALKEKISESSNTSLETSFYSKSIRLMSKVESLGGDFKGERQKSQAIFDKFGKEFGFGGAYCVSYAMTIARVFKPEHFKFWGADKFFEVSSYDKLRRFISAYKKHMNIPSPNSVPLWEIQNYEGVKSFDELIEGAIPELERLMVKEGRSLEVDLDSDFGKRRIDLCLKALRNTYLSGYSDSKSNDTESVIATGVKLIESRDDDSKFRIEFDRADADAKEKILQLVRELYA